MAGWAKSTTLRFQDGDEEIPGPGHYQVRADLTTTSNPGLGLHSSSDRFSKDKKENPNLSVSSISDEQSTSGLKVAALGHNKRASMSSSRLTISESSLRDAALRRKQMELEVKEKMLRASDGRVSRLEAQMEELRKKCEAAMKAERETRASYAKREQDFMKHDKEIAKLENMIKILQAQNQAAISHIDKIKPVEEENQRLQALNAQIENRVSEMEKDVTDSRQSLSRYIDQIEEVAGDLFESELNMRELQIALGHSQQASQSLQCELSMRQEELEGVNSALTQAREEGDILQRQVEDLLAQAEEDAEERGVMMEELYQLRTSIREAEDHQLRLEGERDTLLDKMTALQESIFHSQNQEEDLCSRYEVLESKCLRLEMDLDQAVRKGEGIQAALGQEQKEHDATSHQLDLMRDENQLFKASNSTLWNRLTSMQNTLETLVAEKESLIEELVSKGQDLLSQQEQVERLTRNLKGLQDELEERKAEKQLMEKKRKAAGDEIEALQKDLEEVCAQSKAEAAASQDRITTLEVELKDMKRDLTSKENDLASLQASKKELENDLEHTQEGLRNMTETAHGLSRQEKQLETSYKELRAQNDVIEQQLAELGQALKEHVGRHGEILEEKEALIGQLEEGQDRLQKVMKEKEEVEQTLQEVGSACEDLKNQVNILQPCLSQTHGQLDETTEKCWRLEESIKDLEQALARRESEASVHVKERAILEDQRLAATQAYQRAKIRSEEFEMELRATQEQGTAFRSEMEEMVARLEAEVEEAREECGLVHHRLSQSMDENVVLKKEVQALEVAAQENEGRVQSMVETLEGDLNQARMEASTWQQKAQSVQRECQQTKHELDSFRNRMADSGYIEKELLSATVESQVAKLQSAMATKEVQKLTKEIGDLAGHRNQKQKIRHLQNLKEELLRLQRDNQVLEVELSAAKKLLKQQQRGAAAAAAGGGGGGSSSIATSSSTSSGGVNTLDARTLDVETGKGSQGGGGGRMYSSSSVSAPVTGAVVASTTKSHRLSQAPQSATSTKALSPRRRRVRTPLKELLWATAASCSSPPSPSSSTTSTVPSDTTGNVQEALLYQAQDRNDEEEEGQAEEQAQRERQVQKVIQKARKLQSVGNDLLLQRQKLSSTPTPMKGGGLFAAHDAEEEEEGEFEEDKENNGAMMMRKMMMMKGEEGVGSSARKMMKDRSAVPSRSGMMVEGEGEYESGY